MRKRHCCAQGHGFRPVSPVRCVQLLHSFVPHSSSRPRHPPPFGLRGMLAAREVGLFMAPVGSRLDGVSRLRGINDPLVEVFGGNKRGKAP